jgi:hypothetical protein
MYCAAQLTRSIIAGAGATVRDGDRVVQHRRDSWDGDGRRSLFIASITGSGSGGPPGTRRNGGGGNRGAGNICGGRLKASRCGQLGAPGRRPFDGRRQPNTDGERGRPDQPAAKSRNLSKAQRQNDFR